MAISANWKHALDMLPFLAHCAKERRLITYKELGELVGYPAFYLGSPLDVLRDEILRRHDLPRLDALVVNQETMQVGEMFYEGGRDNIDDELFDDLLAGEREKVYAYDRWDEIVTNLHNMYGGPNYRRPV